MLPETSAEVTPDCGWPSPADDIPYRTRDRVGPFGQEEVNDGCDVLWLTDASDQKEGIERLQCRVDFVCCDEAAVDRCLDHVAPGA